MKFGDTGSSVERWQQFLVGKNLLSEASREFDQDTLDATIAYQISQNLTPDGIVGPKTLQAAKKDGFNDSPDASSSVLRPMSYTDKQHYLGPLMYVSSPQPGCPEAIKITNDWTKNLVTVLIPQLKGIKGAPLDSSILFHKKGADRLKKLWELWEAHGLLPLILTWDGAWAPRFVRGSKITLSSHSFASAFDINARWNALGVAPPASGQTGSVVDLVPIANDCGFFWGGDFGKPPYGSRFDGMHFELAVI